MCFVYYIIRHFLPDFLEFLSEFAYNEGTTIGLNFADKVLERGTSMKKKNLCLLALGAVLLAGIFTGCSEKKEAVQPDSSKSTVTRTFKQPYELKEFEAETLDGSIFTQENLAEKDVTVLNFWSLTCGPCISEMPNLAEFEKAMPDNVQVLTVCLDGSSDMERTKEILEEAGFEGITLLGGNGDFWKVLCGIQYTPTTLIVDTDGNIVGDPIIGGQKDLGQVFTEAVNQALKKMGKAEIAYAEE